MAANGDDNKGSDDEDGVGPLPVLSDLDRTYRVTVNATNTTSKPGRLILWIDFDRNGTFDADEAAARVIPAGTNAGSFVVSWSSIPPDIQKGVSYLRARFTTDAMNVSDSKGQKSGGEVEDYRLVIVDAGAAVSGRVYIDANSNANEEADEAGISNTVVVLHNTLDNTCRSLETDGDGDYTFTGVPSGDYELYQAHGETTPIPKNCDSAVANNPTGYQSTTDDVIALTILASDVADQDFGEVAGTNNPVAPSNTGVGIAFEPDHQNSILPGNTTFYAHTLTSQADGVVNFTGTDSGNTAVGWTHMLYRDSDCSGTLNGTEGNAPISGNNLGVFAGEPMCVINKVYAPANVPAQDRYEVVTTAAFTFSGGSVVPTSLKVTDITTAGQTVVPVSPAPTAPEVGASRLELAKTVENITQGTAETAAQNQAKPGDFLRYRIYYRNTGSGPITDLAVDDTVPPFTDYVVSSQACNSTPAGLFCTASIAIDQLNWAFTGSLAAGAKGHVSYEVVVDN